LSRSRGDVRLLQEAAGYGRAGQWSQIACKLLAGGRKPWLGLAFGQLITGP